MYMVIVDIELPYTVSVYRSECLVGVESVTYNSDPSYSMAPACGVPSNVPEVNFKGATWGDPTGLPSVSIAVGVAWIPM